MYKDSFICLCTWIIPTYPTYNFNSAVLRKSATTNLSNIYQFWGATRIFTGARVPADEKTEVVNAFNFFWKMIKGEIILYVNSSASSHWQWQK